MNALLQSKDLIGKMNGVIRKSKFTGNAIPRLRLPVGRESHPFLAGFSRNAQRGFTTLVESPEGPAAHRLGFSPVPLGLFRDGISPTSAPSWKCTADRA